MQRRRKVFKDLISKLAIVTGLLLSPVALADDHPHDKGPHGGDVKGFGKYHIEGVRQGDKATFYVLGDDGKTAASVAKSEGGSVTVIVPGKAQQKTDIAAGANFSDTTAALPPDGKSTVLIIIKEGGKTYSAKFNFSK